MYDIDIDDIDFMAKSCESIFWTFEKTSFTHFGTEEDFKDS